MTEDKYKEEVIDPGDKASKLAKEMCAESYQNNQAVDIIPRQAGNFRGAVDFRWRKYILEMMLKGEMSETVQNDGAGGKLQFPAFIGTEGVFYNCPWEIISMCADDIARSGGFPVLMDNDINAKRVTAQNFHLVESLFRGFSNALQKANLINITGEFAIMKHSVTAFCDIDNPRQLIMNWSGSCIGLTHKNKVIDGSKIEPGMPIVGFWEPGYRCNGGTFFTNLIFKVFGPKIRDILDNPRAFEFIKKLCAPSVSYAKIITTANGWNEDGSINKPRVIITGIAHITGGGIWSKLKECLPNNMGAVLDGMPKPTDVLLEAQEMSWDIPNLRLTDLQAHGTLHGGCGMLVICGSDPNILINIAEKEDVKAYIVGYTKAIKNKEIRIQSRFKEGRVLSSKELEQ